MHGLPSQSAWHAMAQIFCGCNKEQREERKGKEREYLQSRGRLPESVESSQTATQSQSTMDALEHGANRILCVSSEAMKYCRSAAPVSRGVHHRVHMNVV
jgi:hypothetical protein